MKRFIDDKGIFEIKIPVTWRYSIKNDKVHIFQEYEKWKPDSFQLSIVHLDNSNQQNKYQLQTSSFPVLELGDLKYFQHPDINDNVFTTKTWSIKFDNKIVFFTFTLPNSPDTDLDQRTVGEKIDLAHQILKEFRLIQKSISTDKINAYRFDMFIQGIGATALMSSKAVENKAFIEATCLIANQIDGLLRIGIVLKKQIINKNREIELEWIYQGASDKKKSEKEIYKKSLDIGIIDKTIFDELYILYNDRNRVIHRFIISDITLAEVEEIAYQYYQKRQSINRIIYDLENEQIKLNIGMTSKGNIETDPHDYIMGKIGKLNYFDEKK